MTRLDAWWCEGGVKGLRIEFIGEVRDEQLL